MSITNKEYPNEFSPQYRKVIEILTIKNGKVRVKGTFSLHGLLYPADVDCFEKVYLNETTNERAINIFHKNFIDVIQKILHSKNIIISKIMAGKNNDEPKQWTIKEIKKNTFKDAITTESLIKIDVIAYVDSIYTDFSMTYQFYNNKILLNNYPLFKESSLTSDIQKLKNEGKYFKMAKRLYIKTKSKKYIKLFNSDVGMLSQISSNIETIIFILENRKILPFRNIENEIDILITRLNLLTGENNLTRTRFNDVLQKCENTHNRNKLIKDLTTLNNSFVKIISAESQKFLKLS